MTDLLIIGGGPAGLTAAIYAARGGKSVTVCERESLGGQITQAHEVRNYPAIPCISGVELGDRLCQHAMDAGAEIEFASVDSLRRTDSGSFTAVTEDGTIESRAVIYAGGARPRRLSLDGEDALVGHGISYCALCDGEFFRGQDVAVAGGGSTAVSDALYLAGICRSVTLIHRRKEFRAEDALLKEAEGRVRFLTPCTVTSLRGTDALTGVTIRNSETGQTEELPVSALFAALGREPDLRVLDGLAALDEVGYGDASEDCRTGTPGLFIAGDCRKKAVRQLTTAVADGTVAATAACAYVDQRKNS